MIEWLNDNSGAVQAIAVVVLVLVTSVYAMAARRQAVASVKMAEEMREQRLSEDRPQLLIDLKGCTPSVDKRRLGEGETIQDFYPTNLQLAIQNVGKGPAKGVTATVVHPRMTFHDKCCGYLLRDDAPWEFDLSCAPLYRHLIPPRALRDWLADRQIHPAAPIGSPLGVLIAYRDMHDRGWVSYLELEYDCETDDETGEYVMWIEPGEQDTIGPLPYEILRERVSIQRVAGS
jgi:hypothetical protein